MTVKKWALNMQMEFEDAGPMLDLIGLMLTELNKRCISDSAHSFEILKLDEEHDDSDIDRC